MRLMTGSSSAAAYPCHPASVERSISILPSLFGCGHHLGLAVGRQVVVERGDDDIGEHGKGCSERIWLRAIAFTGAGA